MASPQTKINGQVVDAVAATNTQVVGVAPAMSMASLYQTLGNSVAMSSLNAVFSQQQSFMTHQAATVQGIATIYGLNDE